MALVHCDETLQSGDMEKAKELSEKVKELYEVRQSIRNFIKMLLFDISKKLSSALE
jgi:RNA processing factor Prp31